MDFKIFKNLKGSENASPNSYEIGYIEEIEIETMQKIINVIEKDFYKEQGFGFSKSDCSYISAESKDKKIYIEIDRIFDNR